MTQDEVIIRTGIVHILDGELGYPVFSEQPLELTPDTNDFFRGLIYRIMSGDEMKQCHFELPEGTDSPGDSGEDKQAANADILHIVRNFSEENIVEDSKKLAEALYHIMNANISIPSADFAVVTFQVHSRPYLALLKMNYKESFVHMTQAEDVGNVNQIIRYRSMLPSAASKLSEAVIIDLSDYSVQIVEKKYEINGTKVNYLSELYLGCHAAMSSKTKMDIVTRAVEQVNKKHYAEQPVKQLEAKRVIKEEIEDTGSVSVERISEKLYGREPEIKEEFDTKMGKYHMEKEEVTPQSDRTTKKFERQCLKTDTGIEINIPMEQYQDSDMVEFITNEDGTISVLIKNINQIIAK